MHFKSGNNVNFNPLFESLDTSISDQTLDSDFEESPKNNSHLIFHPPIDENTPRIRSTEFPINNHLGINISEKALIKFVKCNLPFSH